MAILVNYKEQHKNKSRFCFSNRKLSGSLKTRLAWRQPDRRVSYLEKLEKV
jgi:hypothetical protein